MMHRSGGVVAALTLLSSFRLPRPGPSGRPRAIRGLPLEERYPTKDTYVAAIRQAEAQGVRAGP